MPLPYVQVRDLETISGELCAKDIELMNGAKEKAYTEARKTQGIAKSATPKGMDQFEEVRWKEAPEGGGRAGAGEQRVQVVAELAAAAAAVVVEEQLWSSCGAVVGAGTVVGGGNGGLRTPA